MPRRREDREVTPRAVAVERVRAQGGQHCRLRVFGGDEETGITWDYATLDYYLANTERAVPGKAMNFAGIEDADLRAAVVLHLRKMADKPAKLP